MLSCKQFKFEVKLDEVRREAEYREVDGTEKSDFMLIFSYAIYICN